ncbi:adenosylmethionine decarboxylase [Shewanella intestini]|uniref:Adenosylmethionine decarboxylase n=1 Tax=Shewanella intestini TaxID=2017544 RepID=A0ABS5I1T6_9GAMM|nr:MULTISPECIES: adenosylmethionine decarboxylase [Shewanella]MBR9727788.1 adenosylmethionine decarboxylase [Shewanella intestini]MRG36219.1 adenosylmethionine decarboxylase [Shewanella sp. XMDDZSB0408]
MFFEGSEKKFEVHINPAHGSLRCLLSDVKQQLVAQAGADILSSIKSEHCEAYVLSESSLFIWDNKLIMLTCGQSTLIESALFCIETIGVEHITAFSYQRKNECFAQLQPSTFLDDVKRLNQLIAGQARRIGKLDGHHHYVFSANHNFTPTAVDNTTELMMYHISGPTADYLAGSEQHIPTINQQLNLRRLFADFTLDQYAFKPYGYSVNGIFEQYYFTIHITPQPHNSYVSLETNLDLKNNHVISELLAILQPSHWDFVGFNRQLPITLSQAQYCTAQALIDTEQGYTIEVKQFQAHQTETLTIEHLN